ATRYVKIMYFAREIETRNGTHTITQYHTDKLWKKLEILHCVNYLHWERWKGIHDLLTRILLNIYSMILILLTMHIKKSKIIFYYINLMDRVAEAVELATAHIKANFFSPQEGKEVTR
ncbi:hypothetical protein ACJX0J_014650, partial [Zea mays]